MDDGAIKKLYVVMAVYNGAAYLVEQLESIRQQAMGDWVLLVRDDGSTDGSQEILQRYADLDARIEWLQDDLGNMGAPASFAYLIQEALKRGAGYIACSDQDDVWQPEKIKAAWNELRAIEVEEGRGTPILVHTDLMVVDASLNTVSASFMEFENINNPESPHLSTLLVQNHVVGCTVLANRALCELALPMPRNIRMHDWWLALCAKGGGTLRYLPRTDILYRQHGGNTLGAAGFSHIYKIFTRSWWMRISKRPKLHRTALAQAQELSVRLSDRRIGKKDAQLQGYCRCASMSFGLSRVFCALKLGAKGQNWLTSFLFYTMLLAGRWGVKPAND